MTTNEQAVHAPETPPSAAAYSHPLARNADRIFLAIIFVVCVAAILELRGSEFGNLTVPGAAFWPTIICLFTAMMSIVAIFVGRTAPEAIDRPAFFRVVGTVLALALFIGLYGFVGFIPASAVTLLILMRWVCHEGWVTSILVTLLAPLCCYALFGMALNVTLTPFGPS